MQCYAILHIPTNLYITAPTNKARSATSQEPGKLPRLYSSVRAAKCSLTYYTTGQFIRDRGTSTSWEGELDFYDEGPSLKLDKADRVVFKIGEEYRNRKDYRIVLLELTIKE